MSKELLSENTSRRIYREEDRILKVFSGDFPKEEVFHEAFINARIEAVLGEMVPKVLSLNLRDGSWTLEKEYAKGRTLQELMVEEPSRKQEYLEKMLELQLQIQSHQVPVLEQLKDKMQRQINELGDIDDGTRYELLTRLAGMPRHEKLCHGDLRPSNIILDEAGAYHVIDWVHATKGNASADIARTYLILALDDKSMAEYYLELFCKQTGTKPSYVQDWLPVVAAAQLTKKRPEEMEELRSWLQICDHM